MTNSDRFILSYNRIDKTLRTVYSYKSHLNFIDIVKRTSPSNYIVKKYEQKLIDYARLRNAIIHQGEVDMVVAEPHTKVVEEFEYIEKLICAPPKALYSFAQREVVSLPHDALLVDLIKIMYESQYSNIPILEKHKLIGVANNKLVIQSIANALNKGVSIDEYLRKTRACEILSEDMMGIYYSVLSEEATLARVMDEFEKNRKLVAVLITKSGNCLEKILCMITAYDIVEISDILDKYE